MVIDATWNDNTPAATRISMGTAINHTHQGHTFGGEVGELVWYDHALTDEERTALEDYLATRWGL